MEAESQDSRSECRRCREHGYIERGVDQEGHEAEDSPEALRAVRARGEVPLERARCAALVRTVVGALSARSAVVHQSASTVVVALGARSAVGHQSASTVVGALSARSAVGHQSASTVVSALGARSAVGHQSASTVVSACARSAVGNCEHGRPPSARSAVDKYASTVVSALGARSAVGVQYASIGRQRQYCKECAWVVAICEHGRRRADLQGVRWVRNLRARSSALYMQGVRWVTDMRARSSSL